MPRVVTNRGRMSSGSSSSNSESISLQKDIFGKNTYKNVIDTEFKELIPPNISGSIIYNLEDFFKSYEELFFQIPKFGDINSHEYIANQSSQYIGSDQNSDDISALLEEINQLRKDLLEAQQKIIDLSSNNE